MSQFKDLFSAQASSYVQFRPQYPSELFKYLVELAPSQKLAWDCGTGNGQAASALSPYFEKIIASDPSQRQLSQAVKVSNIDFQISAETNPKIEKNSVDLVTVAQAFHWFDQRKFFSECDRVLVKSGVLALWTYSLAKITPAVDEVIMHLYSEVLRGYWEKERTMVDQGYSQVVLPFKKIEPPPFEMSAEWPVDHLLGYLNTWSAVQAYIKANDKNPVTAIESDLRKAWGSSKLLPVVWPLFLLVSIKD